MTLRGTCAETFNWGFQLFGPCLVVVVLRELSTISPFTDDVTDGDFIFMRLSNLLITFVVIVNNNIVPPR